MQSVCGLKQTYKRLMSPSSAFFGLTGEDTTVEFQSVTGLSPIVSDSFPKIIGMCLGRRSHKRPQIYSLNSRKGQ